jgi:cytochrome c-type biogenesis protein CcmF
VLSSVHAFTEGTIGYWFLAFISIVLLSSLVLLAGRSEELHSEGSLDNPASRETVFLVNNLLLTGFCFTVLLGTLFPLAAEAVRGVKVSVGAPFFNKMTVPICVALLFLVGVGPALPWRGAEMDYIKRRFLPPAALGFIVLAASVLLGVRSVFAALAFSFAAFSLVSNLQEFIDGARARMRAQSESFGIALGRLMRSNPRRYGGYIAHLGVVMVALGITASSTFRTEREATLHPGDTLALGRYTVRFDQLWAKDEPQRFVVGADLAVMNGAQVSDRISPHLNFYRGSAEPVTTPAVRSRVDSDLYINLLAFERDGTTATIHMIIQPLVGWMWFGGLIVGLGAAFSMTPARNRARVAKPKEAVAA